MSDYYEDDEIEHSNVEPQEESKPVKKERYKSDKDQTKRREQARANLEKGRAKRLENLQKKKQMGMACTPKYKTTEPPHIEVMYDYESSDDDELVLTKRSKTKSVPVAKKKVQSDDRLDRLEALLIRSMKQKKAVRPPNPEPAVAKPKPVNPVLNEFKRRLLDL